ncbi:MAG: restriction endonuclease subunit S, partial [Arcobacter sp.]|nr:restriction endonuclease subunit S [Arcobacter sp.]
MKYRIREQKELKPSGVDWLGDIPKDWQVSRLKNFCIIKNGSTPKSDNELFWNGNIIWITPQDIGKKESI